MTTIASRILCFLVQLYQLAIIRFLFFVLNVKCYRQNTSPIRGQAFYVISHDYSHIDVLAVIQNLALYQFKQTPYACIAANQSIVRLTSNLLLTRFSNWVLLFKGSAVRAAIHHLQKGDSLAILLTNIQRNRKKSSVFTILNRLKHLNIPIVPIRISSSAPSFSPLKRNIRRIIQSSTNHTYYFQFLEPIHFCDFESQSELNDALFKVLYPQQDISESESSCTA